MSDFNSYSSSFDTRPYRNILHEFDSYNYTIVLRAVDPSTLNKFTEKSYPPEWEDYSATNNGRYSSVVIAATGGTYNFPNNFVDIAAQHDPSRAYQISDIFVESMNLTYPVGQTFNSNSTKLAGSSGSIVLREPNGFSFYESAISAFSYVSNNTQNSTITERPYLLSIYFNNSGKAGSAKDTSGEAGSDKDTTGKAGSAKDITLKDLTQHIPIFFSESSMDFTASGVRYNVTFFPYALTPNNVGTPLDRKLTQFTGKADDKGVVAIRSYLKDLIAKMNENQKDTTPDSSKSVPTIQYAFAAGNDAATKFLDSELVAKEDLNPGQMGFVEEISNHVNASSTPKKATTADISQLINKILPNNPNAKDTKDFGQATINNAIHKGIDLAVPINQSVNARANGVVTYAGQGVQPYTGYGPYIVVVQHDSDVEGGPLYTIYAHLNRVDVSAGNSVTNSTTLGLSGDPAKPPPGTPAGEGNGAHLHYALSSSNPAAAGTVRWLDPIGDDYRFKDSNISKGVVYDSKGDAIDLANRRRQEKDDLDKILREDVAKKPFIIGIPTGAYPDTVFNKLFINSTYFANSLEKVLDNADPSPTIAQLRVYTTVDLGEYDARINNYKKTITYFFVVYERMSELPVASNAQKSQVIADEIKRRTIRKYDYLFSGGNIDIVRLDIRYDHGTYYLLPNFVNNNPNSANTSTQVQSDSSDPANTNQTTPQQTTLSSTAGTQYVTGALLTSTPVITNLPNNTSGRIHPEIFYRQALMPLFEQKIINIDFDIIGDPELLPKSEVVCSTEQFKQEMNRFNGEQRNYYQDRRNFLSGYDSNMVLIQIGRRPSDDQGKDGFSQNVLFSGFYIVQTVNAQFRENGSFIMTLTAAKNLQLTRIGDTPNQIASPDQLGLIFSDQYTKLKNSSAAQAVQPQGG